MYVCIYVCMYVCIYVCMYVYMYVCMYACLFIKFHITAQSGPVILVIQCHLHSSSQGGNMYNSIFVRLGTDYEIRNQWFFAILEAMTTD